MDKTTPSICHPFQAIDDDQWLDLLIRSVETPTIDGYSFPGFPADAVQSQFTGSSNTQTLREAAVFYQTVKAYCSVLGMPLHAGSRVLDFGVGWGRFPRFFMKDVAVENIHGCDIDPDVLQLARGTRTPGSLDRIYQGGKLPYADATFDCIVAYSVFTHLPEDVHSHWRQELARVAKPGCVMVFTIEPRRFIDFIAGLDPHDETLPPWHKFLASHAGQAADLYGLYDSGKIAYISSGGGDHRDASVYGDAAVPIEYIRNHWAPPFAVRDYIDDPVRFWQAVVIVQYA